VTGVKIARRPKGVKPKPEFPIVEERVKRVKEILGMISLFDKGSK
jgi:hypothetical protein